MSSQRRRNKNAMKNTKHNDTRETSGVAKNGAKNADASRPGSDSGRARAKETSEQLAAQAQQQERRQTTIIGISACVAVIAVIACIATVVWALNRPAASNSSQNANQTAQNSQSDVGKDNASSDKVNLRQARTNVGAVKVAPEHSDSNGGFLLSRNGLDKPVKNAPTVAVYMDFMCPGCGALDRQMAPTWNTMIASGQINMEIHPNAFLDAMSSDNYSTRAASAVAYVADKDPQHAMAFIQNLFDTGFQPKEGPEYTPISDEAIKNQAIKAGVSEDVASQAVRGDYKQWIQALAIYTPMRPAVQHPDGANKGEMTTPTITINGEYWDQSEAMSTGHSVNDAFLHAIGLKSEDIGTAHKMPSIGAKGKPKAE
ncbi:DsbA family protein [Bifidobacterium bombi]|uniref:Thioredoxin-like fold domain-containing protein n=1 Tax=Bifidobacterium bombi DSM 19703 TaxID=1341695 RepID=A0A080N231_9BIFI|nr:thioredoxin domain-containing protein [Bifidobacterium bombi]KFF30987.1 hypothetical protein BBOMB_0316 [Bifidobacterium bombi DSM 19703]